MLDLVILAASLISSSAVHTAGTLPAVLGIPVEFILFALTLVGVALPHTLQSPWRALQRPSSTSLALAAFKAGTGRPLQRTWLTSGPSLAIPLRQVSRRTATGERAVTPGVTTNILEAMRWHRRMKTNAVTRVANARLSPAITSAATIVQRQVRPRSVELSRGSAIPTLDASAAILIADTERVAGSAPFSCSISVPIAGPCPPPGGGGPSSTSPVRA